MQVYTYSEARQKLAIILEQAENTGKVLIRRKDGRTFALVPEKIASSPLDVPSIKANITTQEIVDIIREGRERQNKSLVCPESHRLLTGGSPVLVTVKRGQGRCESAGQNRHGVGGEASVGGQWEDRDVVSIWDIS